MVSRLLHATLTVSLLSIAASATAHGQTRSTDPMPPLPAPQPAGAPRVPTAIERQLPNGMRLLVIPDANATLVTLHLVFPRGSAVIDPEDRAGVGILLGDVLGRIGTDSLDWQAMSNAFLAAGEIPSIAVGEDATTVQYTVVPENLGIAARLTAHLLRRAKLDSTAFATGRNTILQNIINRRARSADIASLLLDVASFTPKHPYGRPFLPPSFARITFADLREALPKVFVPNGATIVVAGRVTVNEAERTFTSALGDWKNNETAPAPLSRGDARFPARPVGSADAMRAVLVDYPGAGQSQLRFGTANLVAEDRYVGQLMNWMVSDVLFRRLRTERGFAYSAFSTYRSGRLTDRFFLVAAVEASKTDSAVALVMQIMDDFRRGAIDTMLLNAAKSALTQSMRSRFATTAGTTNSFANIAAATLQPDYFANYVERIAAVSAADVHRLAGRVFAPEEPVLLVAGDLARIRAPLERLLRQQSIVWTTDGQP